MYSQVVGRVASVEQARDLITALEKKAFGTDEITVLFPNDGTPASVRSALVENGARDVAITGGGVGAVSGAVVGLGVVDVWEGLPNTALGLLIGAAVLASLGALVGSLIGMAFKRSTPPTHGAQNATAILVTVETRSRADTAQARELFAQYGAFDIESRRGGAWA